MRIESSNLNLQGSSYIATATNIEESLNIWTSQGTANTGSAVDVQEFSQQAIMISTSLTSSVAETAYATEDEAITSKEELKLRMIEEFLSRLMGKRVRLHVPKIKLISGGYDSNGQALGSLKLVSFSGNQQQSSAGFGLIYNRSETQIERSRVSFAAEGVVKTADGREINLNLNYNIDQEVLQQSNFQLRAG
ncbi:MAG TPA: hypothetical protein VM577_13840, partial [Anaerovoracaceae bacterium]|nr:hypothetical protein [Anaerovoracaceae bacterium]